MTRAHLHSRHPQRMILMRCHQALVDGAGEARPSGAGIELVFGREERLARHDIHVDSCFLVVPVRVGEGSLRPVVLGDSVLLVGQVLPALGELLAGRGLPSTAGVHRRRRGLGWCRHGHSVLVGAASDKGNRRQRERQKPPWGYCTTHLMLLGRGTVGWMQLPRHPSRQPGKVCRADRFNRPRDFSYRAVCTPWSNPRMRRRR